MKTLFIKALFVVVPFIVFTIIVLRLTVIGVLFLALLLFILNIILLIKQDWPPTIKKAMLILWIPVIALLLYSFGVIINEGVDTFGIITNQHGVVARGVFVLVTTIPLLHPIPVPWLLLINVFLSVAVWVKSDKNKVTAILCNLNIVILVIVLVIFVLNREAIVF